ncbi:hypothetical protein, partial [Mammaliicoccus vitulinus]|uniref:hypothetical protein n=1 Tax=Mammaliicoccus vitulinus TaxID=71237 RepID=UPI00248C9343
MILNESNLLFNKLDYIDNDYVVNTYLCCCSCVKATKIQYIEYFNGIKDLQCPNCHHCNKSQFGQTLKEGTHIRKVKNKSIYVLLNKLDRPIESYNVNTENVQKHLRMDKSFSNLDLTEKFEFPLGSVLKNIETSYENLWYENNDFNGNFKGNPRQYSMNVDFETAKNVVTKRNDSSTHYRFDVSYTRSGHLCMTDDNLWIFPLYETRIITMSKQLKNLRSTNIHEIYLYKKGSYKTNYPIDNFDDYNVLEVKNFKNEIVNNLDKDCFTILRNTNTYQYEFNKINRLSSKDLSIIAIYPNMYYVWKLVNFKLSPKWLWDSLGNMQHKRRVLKNESNEKEFFQNYFDIKLSKTEKNILSENPNVILLYNSIIQNIKNANHRIVLLRLLASQKNVFNSNDDFFGPVNTKNALKYIKREFKKIIKPSKFEEYYDNILFKLLKSIIKNHHIIKDYYWFTLSIKESSIDLGDQIKLFESEPQIEDLNKILKTFVNSNQTFQNFETKLTEYILNNHLINSDGNDYRYSITFIINILVILMAG